MTNQALIDAAERVCNMLDERGIERVEDPNAVWELSDGTTYYFSGTIEGDGAGVCRTCVRGSVELAKRAKVISAEAESDLLSGIESVLTARRDRAEWLKTVPDRAAMKEVIRAAARLEPTHA